MSVMEVKVPDIGDFKSVPVVEIHVKAGDMVDAEAPLMSLESDKATMDVPSPAAGRVVKVLVKIGDKVSEGSAIVQLEEVLAAGKAAAPAKAAASKTEAAKTTSPTAAAPGPPGWHRARRPCLGCTA